VGAMSAAYQQNVISLYNAFTNTLAPTQPATDATTPNGGGFIITGGTGACMAASYWDIGVRGDVGPADHGSGVTLSPQYSVITNVTGYATNNTAADPTVKLQYCNGSRVPPEAGALANGAGWDVPPGISDATVPNPIFSLTPVATVDEGNNWINLRWGPLSTVNPVTNAALSNYGPAAGSPVINYIPAAAGVEYTAAPSTDFYGNLRKTNGAVDAGAVEFLGAAVAVVNVTPVGPVAFCNVTVGTTSASKTLTVSNTGGANFTGLTVVVTAPFAPATGAAAGTCGTTLAFGATCTVNVVFSPTAAVASTGSVTITGNVAVTGSPVALSGTGVAAVVSATLTPASWTIAHARNCPGTGFGVFACDADPVQAFTLKNTGNVTLTGIAQGLLGGTAANDANYTVVRALSTCGPATGGQLVANVTLAPGATCNIEVQFKPLTGQAAGAKPATISVTDGAGTQTSTLTGTAQ
jgi:Abnormal spindle-like microcephaly-assoc'd, ASPM-SPD-2-Hydin